MTNDLFKLVMAELRRVIKLQKEKNEGKRPVLGV